MNTKTVRVLSSLIVILTLSSCEVGSDITFEEPSVQPPLAKIRVTKRNAKVAEVFATLQNGLRITNVVDISMFDGLTHRMTRGEVTQQLGYPKSVRIHPEMRLPVDIYPVSKGEIGFMSVPTSGGAARQPQIWAFPTNQSPAVVILDESVRKQLVALLPSDRPIRVHVIVGESSGFVTLNMASNRVVSLILGPKVEK